MQKSALILTTVLLTACAPRVNLALLDTLVANEDPAAWSMDLGSACDFRQPSHIVCVSARDNGTLGFARPHREVDVAPMISGILLSKLPGVTTNCEAPMPRIGVQYSAGYSMCTHCGDPPLGTRLALATVQIEQPHGVVARASWSDKRGGSVEQVASRFAASLALFLHEARTMTCDLLPPADRDAADSSR